MGRPRVFISYSQLDEKALAQLRRFLVPLERAGRVGWWADTRIERGDDWEREIDEALDAASVAVVLVSQDFLASNFIVTRELPRLLARERAGQVTVIPVFWSPSLVEELEIPFADPKTGGPSASRLSRFQGVGTPGKPLSGRSWSEREKLFQALGKRLMALAPDDSVAPGEAPEAQGRGAPTESARDHRLAPREYRRGGQAPPRDDRLTVQLERRGADLVAHYHLPSGEILGPPPQPWGDVEEGLVELGRRLDDLGQRALRRFLDDSARGLGVVLFRLLFGAEERWEPVLRAVFGWPAPAPRPNPTFGAVRLRIATDDPLLLGLPWRLTTWQGQRLTDSGWTFATTFDPDPTADILTTAPPAILAVIPRAAGASEAPPGSDHARALKDLLEKVLPTGRIEAYLREAVSRADLEAALARMRPHLLYVYAGGETRGGQPCILLDGPAGPDPLPLAGLAALLQRAGQAPRALYLNVSGLGDSRGPALPQILGRVAPLLVWRRLPDRQADSTSRALDWLAAWLGEGLDPVAALHWRSWEDPGAGLEASTLAVHASYRTWRTERPRGPARRAVPHLRLDRDHQKALAAKHLAELARSDSRRVLALVGYGALGNRLQSLSEQLQDYFELESTEVVALRRLRLEFPGRRNDLVRDLPEELKLQLGPDANRPLPQKLRDQAPTVAGTPRRAVLWLDWGVFGSGQQPPLTRDQRAAWLRFASEYLGVQCPQDMRLITSAAFEVEPRGQDALAEELLDHRRQDWARNPAFRLTILPPVGQVSEDDLLYFLEDPANSSCEPALHAEAATLLTAATGGNFAAMTSLIEEAERGSWYDLLARLRGEAGAESAA